MIILILAMIGCDSVQKIKDLETKYTLVSRIEDAQGDDSGPGCYRYPKRYFQKGDFDLTSLEIREGEDNYVFVIEILNAFTNFAALSKGWDKQIFDIYIFNSEGTHRQAIADRRVKFSSSWEKAILIAPFSLEKMNREVSKYNTDVHDSSSDSEDLSKDIIIPTEVAVRDNRLYVFVSKDKIGKIEGVQLFVMPAELAHETTVKEVEEFDNGHAFFGGSYAKIHPNVIDILGDNNKLGSYNVSTMEYSVIDMIPLKE